ncbi:hypothetical protein [Auraticoccus monumenti]|uniref:PknH-like extracellular domain-containing protein n=1 Tax=Auraticoccus monumenti TaxID=675864 RepID=A0A1G7F378_9ACTN|nr:hypothetical protein [Auraticoccus monumenti]SDE70388.1 hypothetical protein SAMN04489747_4131 [Auraticoccus monumenti]
MRVRAARALVVAAAALVLTGCGAGSPPTVTPTPSSTPTGGPTATGAGDPTAGDPTATEPTAAPSTGAGSATPPPDREPPPRPTEAAPSTAGDLGQDDLPREVLGFTAEEREPAEGEYVPNGTWTHAVDAEQAAWEAAPRCGAEAPEEDVPTAALAATYLDGRGRPGNGLLMSFDDEDAARGYAGAYRGLLLGCPHEGEAPLVTEPLAEEEQWYAGRRGYGPERWSELVVQNDDRVLLLIVNDDGAADVQQLRGLAEELAG